VRIDGELMEIWPNEVCDSPSILSFKELVPKILSYPTIETFIDESHSILKKLPIEDLGVRKFMVLELALFGEVMT